MRGGVMPRLARVVLPGCPHHVTQRGVRSMSIFRDDADCREYLRLIKQNAEKHGVRFMAYCLMTNHIHFVAIPEREDSLARAIGEAHRLYTRNVNFRLGVRGYLFQGRFFSCPMDERHTVAAVSYVERNPVRAGLAAKAWDYPWSSAGFHAGYSECNPLIQTRGFFASSGEWRKILDTETFMIEEFRSHFRTGRPLGSVEFSKRAEYLTGRVLLPLPSGRKKQTDK